MPLLREGVFEPRRNGLIPHSWTNNNSESANHVLKCIINWKPQSLPTLIEKLESYIIAQEKDFERALIRQGNFVLSPTMRHHAIPVQVWVSLGPKQKEGRLNGLIKRKVVSPDVQSTDGKLIVRHTPSKGKKPGQKKRKAAERTVSAPPKKRKL